ncbi:MAG TPA: hypothetical protein VGH38_17935, partial [Bryobacteraceae bacterium]
MIRQSMALAVAFGLLGQDAALAQAPTLPNNQVPIAWEELAALVVDRKITTTIPDGTRLEGEALAVRPEALVLDVQKSSNRKLHPKGQTEVRRLDVSEVRVIRLRGPDADHRRYPGWHRRHDCHQLGWIRNRQSGSTVATDPSRHPACHGGRL